MGLRNAETTCQVFLDQFGRFKRQLKSQLKGHGTNGLRVRNKLKKKEKLRKLINKYTTTTKVQKETKHYSQHRPDTSCPEQCFAAV